MIQQLIENKFFYITFISGQSYMVTKLTASSHIQAIQRFNRVYIANCRFVTINHTNKILNKATEELIITCHPN